MPQRGLSAGLVHAVVDKACCMHRARQPRPQPQAKDGRLRGLTLGGAAATHRRAAPGGRQPC
eukprot:5739720-Alexandrium_andersonii.AAC.1